jgi:hypothetical protein
MTSGTDAATVVLVYHAMSIGVLASSMTGPHSRGEEDSQLGGSYVN